ncbi:hypothetical protein [Neoactinobaculum massilliense]|uniref:hypothetical protein n=1 Tax=Neoactinobaculum massilliense TaxID=2364794 RepID=UPI000F53D362|nr:hypothetical protein [Neoactinobaculum massilliense]
METKSRRSNRNQTMPSAIECSGLADDLRAAASATAGMRPERAHEVQVHAASARIHERYGKTLRALNAYKPADQ